MKKEKLLLMGVSSDTVAVLEYAKSIGVFTVITDMRTPEECPQKQLADEYWMIDLKNLDLLEEKCRKAGITGLYAGNNEFCLEQTRKLCLLLRLPFYASEEGYACSTDKARFKRRCVECGLAVPKQYKLDLPFDEKQLSGVCYPVIVKPVDASGLQGRFICNTEEALRKACEKALVFSKKKQILVEEFIKGSESIFYFFLVHGKPYFLGMEENTPIKVQVGETEMGAIVQHVPRESRKYSEMESSKIEKLFQKLGCKEGAVSLQTIRKEGVYYFHEMCYRLDGAGSWITMKKLYGVSNLELMVDLALGRPYSFQVKKLERITEKKEKVSAIYLLWSKEGVAVEIKGKGTVDKMDGVEIIWERVYPGKRIGASEDLYRALYGISIIAEDYRDMDEKIRFINNTLKVLDENGDNLLLPCDGYGKVYCNGN